MNNELLKILDQNARYSNKELSSMLGVSEEEIKAEIARLEKEGVIKGYRALINWENYDRLGQGV